MFCSEWNGVKSVFCGKMAKKAPQTPKDGVAYLKEDPYCFWFSFHAINVPARGRALSEVIAFAVFLHAQN